MSPKKRTIVATVAAGLVGIVAVVLTSGADAPPAANARGRAPAAPSVEAPRPPAPIIHLLAARADAAVVRRLAFVALDANGPKPWGLEVAVTPRCGDARPDGGGERRLSRTNRSGKLELPDVPADCELELEATDPRIALRLDEDDVVTVLSTGSATIEVHDVGSQPVAGARLEARAGRFAADVLARCETGSNGRCELPCPRGESYSIEASKAGYETTVGDVDCDWGSAGLTLRPGRRLTVHVEGPGSRFLSTLWLDVDAPGFRVRRKVDAPGTQIFEGCPRAPLELGLSEAQRPFLVAKVGAGDDGEELTMTMPVARRLEVISDASPDSEYGFLPPPIDVRCAGVSRLMLETTRSADGKHDTATIEYSPPGPCVVARGQTDWGWDTDPDYAPVTVDPPGSATLRRR